MLLVVCHLDVGRLEVLGITEEGSPARSVVTELFPFAFNADIQLNKSRWTEKRKYKYTIYNRGGWMTGRDQVLSPVSGGAAKDFGWVTELGASSEAIVE
jgi:hypothetical protein